MSYASEFYVTVRSDDSANYFPDNTQSDFYIKLPYFLALSADWCVGVNQMWLDKTWYNVKDISLKFIADTEDETILQLQDGYYEDIETLINALNSLAVAKDVQLCLFTYEKMCRKVSIKVSAKYTMEISPYLANMLGTDKTSIKGKLVKVDNVSDDKKEQTISLEQSYDLHLLDKQMYVYTDIIAGQMSNDAISGLLKIVDTSQCLFGGVIYDNFISNYSRVMVDTFDVIHIKIVNAKQDVINFCGGKTVIQLHFKRQ